MADISNPVPLGQSGTGEAVVFAPSNAYKFIQQSTQAEERRNLIKDKTKAAEQKAELAKQKQIADETAKYKVDGDVWFPFAGQYKEKVNTALGRAASMYEKGEANTPAGQMLMVSEKTDLTLGKRKIEDVRQMYDKAGELIRKNTLYTPGGDIPLMNAEKAEEVRASFIYNKDGTVKQIEEISDTDLESQLIRNPDVYNDVPVFKGILNTFAPAKDLIGRAGSLGGTSNTSSIVSNAPFERDKVTDAIIYRDEKGNAVKDPSKGKVSIDKQKLYNVAQADPIAAAKLNKMVDENYNTRIKTLQQDPNFVNTGITEAQNAEIKKQAINDAVEAAFGPLITTNYSMQSRRNAQPRKAAKAAGETEIEEGNYSITNDPIINVGYTNPKGEVEVIPTSAVVRINLNPNVGGEKGLTKTLVTPTTKIFDNDTGKLETPTTGFEGRSGAMDVRLVAKKDFVGNNGKSYKVGQLVTVSNKDPKLQKDAAFRYYNQHKGDVEFALVQPVQKGEGGDKMIKFTATKKDAIDPVTRNKVPANSTVEVPYGTPEYDLYMRESNQWLQSGTVNEPRSKRQVDVLVGYIRPDANGVFKLVQEGEGSGFVSKGITQTVEKLINSRFTSGTPAGYTPPSAKKSKSTQQPVSPFLR